MAAFFAACSALLWSLGRLPGDPGPCAAPAVVFVDVEDALGDPGGPGVGVLLGVGVFGSAALWLGLPAPIPTEGNGMDRVAGGAGELEFTGVLVCVPVLAAGGDVLVVGGDEGGVEPGGVTGELDHFRPCGPELGMGWPLPGLSGVAVGDGVPVGVGVAVGVGWPLRVGGCGAGRDCPGGSDSGIGEVATVVCAEVAVVGSVVVGTAVVVGEAVLVG